MSALRTAARTAVHLSRDAAAEVRYATRAVARNAPERLAFRRRQAEAMDPTAADVLARLERDGYVLLPLEDLVPDADLRRAADAAADAFAASDAVRDRMAGAATAGPSDKEYLVRLLEQDDHIDVDHPLLRLATAPVLLDVASRYLELQARVRYVNLWYTVPVGDDASERVHSQRWHRDWEDKRQLKAFVYFSDVTTSSGALEYVRGSRAGGPNGRWSRRRSQLYPEDGAFARRIPADDIVRFEGPRGTLALCDTTGFHRGGFAVDAPRLVGTWLYATPATYSDRRFVVGGDLSHLCPEARTALLG